MFQVCPQLLDLRIRTVGQIFADMQKIDFNPVTCLFSSTRSFDKRWRSRTRTE